VVKERLGNPLVENVKKLARPIGLKPIAFNL